MGLPQDAHTANDNLSRILDSFAHFGVKLGLESTHQLLSCLKNPHRDIPIIHVAGTNGKGSVCAYLSTILVQAGYRVGRYTSPHLIDWPERICINNQPIAAAALLTIVQNIQSVIHTHKLDATQFEVITAAAWLYFAKQQVDLAVMEVGLGGRLDTTNVCDRPLASVITSIGRDHWQQLGDTPSKIAAEKAGIFKSHCPAIIGPLPPDAQTTVADIAHALNCPTQWVSPALSVKPNMYQYCPRANIPNPSDSSTRPSSKSVAPSLDNQQPQPLTYSLALKGEHQRINSAVAIATVHALQQQGWQITTDHIRQGLANAQWPGRLQWITWNGHQILIDGAHNTAAATVLRQYGDTLAQPIHWVIGMLASKDHPGVLKTLLKKGDRLSLVPVPDNNTAQPEDLTHIAQTYCPVLKDCNIYSDIVTALNQAIASKTSTTSITLNSPSILEKPQKSGTLIVCGSLYLIGYLLQQKKRLNA